MYRTITRREHHTKKTTYKTTLRANINLKQKKKTDVEMSAGLYTNTATWLPGQPCEGFKSHLVDFC